jgi:hypothetical protein
MEAQAGDVCGRRDCGEGAANVARPARRPALCAREGKTAKPIGAHARRAADLPVYVRQHHGERDLATLGRHDVQKRAVPVIDAARGTPEATWASSSQLQSLRELAWGPRGRVVAIAPHPDDETLSMELFARGDENQRPSSSPGRRCVT